ncbi:MAG: polyisoprenoid-binding protein [Paludibacterium sp.]|uniref:YceI family protein n=1 Tax=Paludibacterium sp. TaxID=1917523 RepID=UPI0025E1050A|nr:YceI family protein [Paludibacterium sp.]MBV8049452.1 polyisoprenoid-binding protein [Paludibacterium sp.]MBV8645992.1 polyisoprenoid-binding protein [Paludibacterium sp.]
MKKLLIASLLAAASAVAFAAPVTYTVDPSHTYAAYDINHMGFSNQSGTFTRVSGTVTLDTAAHSGVVDVTVDTDSLQTFWPARDKHLKSEAFFNVAKYPTMTYKADKLVFDGDKLTRVEGNLTLLGVTKPVTLTITNYRGGKNPMVGKDEYAANAVAQIKRSDFGMTTYLPAIADDVTLRLTIEALGQ